MKKKRVHVSMILDKLYIDGRPFQEEIEGGVGVLRKRSHGDQIGRRCGASGLSELKLRGQSC